MPAPTISAADNDKYEEFTNLAATTLHVKPTETCKPSAKTDLTHKSELNQPDFKYVNSKARACIICQECGKGRLLYSDHVLTREQLDVITDKKDLFVCGVDLFINTQLHKVVFQHHKNNCNKVMTAAFYSTGPKCFYFEKVCSVCTEIGDFAQENSHFVGLPRCLNCKEKNNFFHHKNPSFKRKNFQ